MPIQSRWHRPPWFGTGKFLAGLTPVVVVAAAVLTGITIARPSAPKLVSTAPAFIAAVDTSKESRDTDTHPLTQAQITSAVKLIATLNVNYITVETYWDYPTYLQEWVSAIRATGKHVWFRTQPNQWQDSNGTNGIMTPSAYLSAESAFIKAHPSFFKSGDIFDPLSEPENGKYFTSLPSGWSWRNAPNSNTDTYNNLILNTTSTANSAFSALKISGVITNIRSTNTFFAEHTSSLYASTTSSLGRVTIDSYPEGSSTNPTTCANDRVAELQAIRAVRPGLPIMYGEFGYSDQVNVSDATQASVLQAEFNALKGISYLAGANYWVGPGTDTDGGYTQIFSGGPNTWTLRPAAKQLSSFFAAKLG